MEFLQESACLNINLVLNYYTSSNVIFYLISIRKFHPIRISNRLLICVLIIACMSNSLINDTILLAIIYLIITRVSPFLADDNNFIVVRISKYSVKKCLSVQFCQKNF